MEAHLEYRVTQSYKGDTGRQLSEILDPATEMKSGCNVQTRGIGHEQEQGRVQGQTTDLLAAESACKEENSSTSQKVCALGFPTWLPCASTELKSPRQRRPILDLNLGLEKTGKEQSQRNTQFCPRLGRRDAQRSGRLFPGHVYKRKIIFFLKANWNPKWGTIAGNRETQETSSLGLRVVFCFVSLSIHFTESSYFSILGPELHF